MRTVYALTLAATLAAGPALAASGPFISLGNTDFIVLLAFIAFIGVLIYFKVPSMLTGMLDQRAEGIASEIEEAKGLQEEAKKLLADFERKQKDVQAQADRIVTQAREEAELAAEQARADLKASIARRLTAAEEQIASAQAGAVKEVRDRAVNVAISAAQEVIAKQMNAERANSLIDDAIAQVGDKLH